MSSTFVRDAASTSIRSTNRPSLISRQALQTPHGVARYAGFAVQALREDACDGGFADAARAGEQIRVMNAFVLERMHQRAHDMILSHEGIEPCGAEFACEHLVTHREILETPLL